MNIDFASELDPDQYRAVTTTEGPLLIIAGAGSGKTRVIIYRIARLLSLGVPQESILALTFTNKAAREMADRTRELTGLPLKNLIVSTFHSFGAWILRKEIHRLGWKDNFTIYDEQDRIQAAKECARELGFAMADFDGARAVSYISSIRTGFSPARSSREDESSMEADGYSKLFEEYRRTLKVYNAADFDDLIAMPLEIFSAFPETVGSLRKRFRYVMIDEFQDTSYQQYELVRAFAPDNICAVGDDDQSIYSWRGANFGNIEKFEKDHPGIVEIKLERNYRSTSLILDAANALISHNVKRKKKNLWSPGRKRGVPIMLEEAEDEAGEAEGIVARMKKMRISDGLPWDAFGILVRTNSQARVIEETLMEAGLPYRTAGGPSLLSAQRGPGHACLSQGCGKSRRRYERAQDYQRSTSGHRQNRSRKNIFFLPFEESVHKNGTRNHATFAGSSCWREINKGGDRFLCLRRNVARYRSFAKETYFRMPEGHGLGYRLLALYPGRA